MPKIIKFTRPTIKIISETPKASQKTTKTKFFPEPTNVIFTNQESIPDTFAKRKLNRALNPELMFHSRWQSLER